MTRAVIVAFVLAAANLAFAQAPEDPYSGTATAPATALPTDPTRPPPPAPPSAALKEWYEPTPEDAVLPWNRRDAWNRHSGGRLSVDYAVHSFFGGNRTGVGSEVTLRLHGANIGGHAGVYLPSNLGIVGVDFFRAYAVKVADFRSSDVQIGILLPCVDLRLVFNADPAMFVNLGVPLTGLRVVHGDFFKAEVRIPVGFWARATGGTEKDTRFFGSYGGQFDVGIIF